MDGPDFQLFTLERPLGPIAISDRYELGTLQALYDERVALHVQSEHTPPTFIVGRRGSGKTALLLSREFDETNLAIRISTAGLFNSIQRLIATLRDSHMIVTVETVAEVWELLLWGPIAYRLSQREIDPTQASQQLIYEELAPLRALPEPVTGTADDQVLDVIVGALVQHLRSEKRAGSIQSIASEFRISSRPWAHVIGSAREIVASQQLPVYVLVDSLEDVGEILDDVQETLKGLFHLVGKAGSTGPQRGFFLQCCFPSELWPILDKMSANPVKDLSGRLVLQWQWRDLARACDARLEKFLTLHFPQVLEELLPRRDLLISGILPDKVTTRTGREEMPIPYILRHTQLLPRQVLYIFNEVLTSAIIKTGAPHATSEIVVNAVGEVEATLCPELFRAHSHRFPDAAEVTQRIVRHLDFRFTEGNLHKAYNEAGIKKRFGLAFFDTQEMLADCGVVGRFLEETAHYHKAEFAYTLEGQLALNPDDEFCLHPMFVRQFGSRALTSGKPSPKPVYPVGVPDE